MTKRHTGFTRSGIGLKSKRSGSFKKHWVRYPGFLRTGSVFIGIVLILAGSFLIYHWISNSPIFRLSSVEITGAVHTKQQSILQIAGLSTGMNLVSLKQDELSKEIESLEWVKEASVIKKFPDRLVIQIREYRPVALVSSDQGMFLVDENGRIFRKVRNREVWDLPIITGMSPDQMGSGFLSQEGMKALYLLDLASKGARTLGVNNISEIHLGDQELVLYTMEPGVGFHMRLKCDQKALRAQFKRAEKVLLHLYNSGLYRKVAKVDLDYGSSEAWAALKGRR